VQDRKSKADMKIAGLSKIILSALRFDLSLRVEQKVVIFENNFERNNLIQKVEIRRNI
jgi:hypothetical protein